MVSVRIVEIPVKFRWGFWFINRDCVRLGIALHLYEELTPFGEVPPRLDHSPAVLDQRTMQWLIKDFDLGFFTFKELTRSIAWILEWPLSVANSLLATGFTFSTEPGAPVLLPPAPWIAIVSIVGLLAFHSSGIRLTLLVTGCFLYLVARCAAKRHGDVEFDHYCRSTGSRHRFPHWGLLPTGIPCWNGSFPQCLTDADGLV